MVEFGPGDTIGVGLAALLSGVRHYTGLDAVPFAERCSLVPFFDELVATAEESGADSGLVLRNDVVRRIRADLEQGMNGGALVRYETPWSINSVRENSVDLVCSSWVLDAVDRLKETFTAMYSWLRAGGYACHRITCNAWHLSPYWNGHWAYSDFEWRLVRGRRVFLRNREPISTYVRLAEATGFEVMMLATSEGRDGLPQAALAPQFRNLDTLDSSTQVADLVLRKPA